MSNWGAIRKNGVFRFIIVNGIFFVGIPVAIVTAVVRFYFGTPGTHSWREYLTADGTGIGYILQAVITGVIFGAIVWFLNERSYRSTARPESEIDEA